MDNNTIAAFHVVHHKNKVLKLYTNQLYHWHIPKKLRPKQIQAGDIVLIETNKGHSHVLVMNVFREELEETNKTYKRVCKIIERKPKKD